MNPLADRAELIELLGRYADIADLKEFDALPGLVFTDPVTLDFESVVGTPPMTVALSEYVEILRGSFARWAATHHAITGHVIEIEGDRARVHAHVRAEHWLAREAVDRGTDRWLVVGFYDDEAVRTPAGWRLHRVRLTSTYQENPELSRIAPGRERATT
jgi:hypothetical protein